MKIRNVVALAPLLAAVAPGMSSAPRTFTSAARRGAR